MGERRPDVVVALNAGLGNQLFQFAAGWTVARERGGDLYVYEKRDVGFSEFVPIDFQPATKRMVDRLVLGECNRSSFLGRGSWEVRAQWFKLDPRYFTLRPEDPFCGQGETRLVRHQGPLGMDGYFQHPRWYEPVLPEILDALRRGVASVARQRERSFVEEFGEFTAVSLRRGDYVRDGWALPSSYYESALDALPKNDGPVVLLSDDDLVSAFAARWFEAKGFEVIPESVLGERSRHRDLALLADASQVVMSNSTFCWWGTVLGDECGERDDQARFVVAPRKWLVAFPTSPVVLRPRWLAL